MHADFYILVPFAPVVIGLSKCFIAMREGVVFVETWLKISQGENEGILIIKRFFLADINILFYIFSSFILKITFMKLLIRTNE